MTIALALRSTSAACSSGIALLRSRLQAWNIRWRSASKTLMRRLREAVDAGDADQAKKAAADASRALDKAASKGVIHKNQAANRKSALNKQAASL